VNQVTSSLIGIKRKKITRSNTVMNEDDEKEVWAFGWKLAGRLEMTEGGGAGLHGMLMASLRTTLFLCIRVVHGWCHSDCLDIRTWRVIIIRRVTDLFLRHNLVDLCENVMKGSLNICGI